MTGRGWFLAVKVFALTLDRLLPLIWALLLVPFSALTGQSGASTYPTWWTSATDLEQGIYYFNWSMNPNVFWLDTKEIDFSNGSGVRFIDPKEPSLSGNVNKLLRTYNP